MKINNYRDLVSHGDIESRKIILDITDTVLQRLDAYHRIKSIMKLSGDILSVGCKQWDLSKKKNVYLIGAGKACNHMARAVDEVLGDRLTKGIIIVKVLEETDVYQKTKAYVGGHPLPNETGFFASNRIISLIDTATKDDLFIVVISGGSSALMSCPVDGISLDDEIRLTDILLKSGANIFEINAIRRHISKLNGGMLAKRIAARGAELIGLGISDAVGSPATDDICIPYDKYKGTPMGPDQTTFEDAQKVIKDYQLQNLLPSSAIDYIAKAGAECETPKAFPENTYFLINTLPDSCRYAKEAAENLGIPAMILTSYLDGEAKDIGTFFASIAKEIQTHGNPIKPPCIVIASGEATTKIPDSSIIKGHGGPSQEETLSFAVTASKTQGACLLSIDSEGTDGTTMAAGGMTDSLSYSEAQKRGIDIYDSLRTHSSFETLCAIGDSVFTGNTGTNLCDFNVMYVPAVE